MATTLDSNLTGLRYAEEGGSTIGTLSGAEVWYALEPNSYGDFGPQITTLARTPINSSRQRKKGITVDLDAQANFQSDFVTNGLKDMLQGFFFADWTEQDEFKGTAITVATSDDSYGATDIHVGLAAGNLIFASGFSNSTNNGLKHVVTATGDKVTVTENLADETSAITAVVKMVGVQGTSNDLVMDASTDATKPRITSTTLDLSALGFEAGDWVFVGGDSTATAFGTAGNNGFFRVYDATDANALIFDKFEGTPSDETPAGGAGSTLQIFLGDRLHNEDDPTNIKRRTYQFERQLPGTTGFEYVLGGVPNQLTINIGQADKLTVDLSFMCTDGETKASGSRKAGTFPALVEEDAFNATSDFSALRLVDSSQTALATYLTEGTISINNGATPNKAVAALGAIEVTTGDFVVSGAVTAYFTDLATIAAVRNNSDVTLDFALVKGNEGFVFDLPLVTLGNGRLSVEKDQAITIPLDIEAARHETLTYTLKAMNFDYLPDLADI